MSEAQPVGRKMEAGRPTQSLPSAPATRWSELRRRLVQRHVLMQACRAGDSATSHTRTTRGLHVHVYLLTTMYGTGAELPKQTYCGGAIPASLSVLDSSPSSLCVSRTPEVGTGPTPGQGRAGQGRAAQDRAGEADGHRAQPDAQALMGPARKRRECRCRIANVDRRQRNRAAWSTGKGAIHAKDIDHDASRAEAMDGPHGGPGSAGVRESPLDPPFPRPRAHRRTSPRRLPAEFAVQSHRWR